MNESSFLGPVPIIVLHMSNVKHGAFREKWYLQINQIMPDEFDYRVHARISAWQKNMGYYTQDHKHTHELVTLDSNCHPKRSAQNLPAGDMF